MLLFVCSYETDLQTRCQPHGLLYTKVRVQVVLLQDVAAVATQMLSRAFYIVHI